MAFFRRAEKERPPPSPGLAEGTSVGDFRLLSLIGEGGMGQVWEAEQLSLGKRRVAVKLVRVGVGNARLLEFFAREARAGGRLNHSGIVAVHGHGQSEGLAWIAMELVSGAWTLRDFLDEVERAAEVPEDYDRHVARFVAEIAEAMQAAHGAGVIHRDLKPQNVLVTPDDHPKVSDFGLARIVDEAALSSTGDIAGTYLYMSPEQVAARRGGIDHRTDVFSLGVMLYELLALQRPFQGDTSQQIAVQILNKDPADPRTIRSRIPRDLAVITGKALEKARDARFQSMQEFAADLRRFLGSEPILARPPTPLDRALKWIRRNPAKSSVAAVGLVALIAISGLLVKNIEANRDLADKSEESETRRRQAELNAKRADFEAQQAIQRANEVLRLSALQQLDDLVARAARLWPAYPENIERIREWLQDAEELAGELSTHEAQLNALRARSIPWTEEELAELRSSHPLLSERDRVWRELDFLRRRREVIEATEPSGVPSAEEAGVVWSVFPADARGLSRSSWALVDPERKDWGGEIRGLVLTRRALELAGSLPAHERAPIRATLSWALLANGRIDEAVTEAEAAVEEAAAAQRAELEGRARKLKEAIDELISPEGQEAETHRVAELEQRLGRLEAELSRPSRWSFADPRDRWWHDQLETLVNGIVTLADPETGLYSAGISPEHGWGVLKRLEFAQTIRERSIAGPEAAQRWSQACDSIASPQECPMYGGLRLVPQLGLLPIGRDPQSRLWEFAHLQTGEPATRASDGRLILAEETGLVLVMLPGGTFLMGAQSRNPAGPNYDPQATVYEGPVHEVALPPFFLSRFELTQGQWLRATGRNPSYFRENRSLAPSLLHPVEQVSWTTCADVCHRLGLLLPSETRWEYGARAGTTTVWWTGDEKESLAGAANLADQAAARGGMTWRDILDWPELDDGYGAHAPVDTFRPNPFGLHHVHGNVLEWCLDRYEDYPGSSRSDRIAFPPGTEMRVNRGGCYGYSAVGARSAHRNMDTAGFADYDLGLRPARDLAP